MSRNSIWNTGITDWNYEINHKWLSQLWMSKTMRVERNKKKHCPQQDLKCEWIWWWNWWCHDIRIHGVDNEMGRKPVYISPCEWSLWAENQCTFSLLNGVYGQKINVHFPFWMEFMGRKPMFISPSEWSLWCTGVVWYRQNTIWKFHSYKMW